MREDHIDWDFVVFVVCMTILAILCAGTPDLLDTIIAYVNSRAGCN